MESEAVRLHEIVNRRRGDLKRLERELESDKEKLRHYQSKCQHSFTEKYDPIIHPAGSSSGDPPGTMGVDWRGPCSWSETREDRWSRYCSKCGLTQYTQSVEKEVKKIPKW